MVMREAEVVGVEQGKKQVSAEGATLLELWPGGPHAARLQGAKEEQEATSFKHLASLQEDARILSFAWRTQWSPGFWTQVLHSTQLPPRS